MAEMFCRSEKRGIIFLGMQKNDVLKSGSSGELRGERLYESGGHAHRKMAEGEPDLLPGYCGLDVFS